MNMQIEHDENGGSELPSCSNVGLTTLAIRKILREELEPMVFNTVRRLIKPMVIAIFQQEIKPHFEESFRRVVKDEIQKLLTGGTRNVLPKERSLQLKFLDEVCGPVQTGIDLKGKNNECLKLALYDENEDIVTCGRESSAKVEIVLLSDNGNDDDGNMTLENFERRIIRTGDKEKPHFAKSVCIYLEKGVVSLTDLKLGHGEKWTKLWNCRLGAKMAENLPRTIVQEAWTEPFKVKDQRIKYYEKCASPDPTSEVWNLKGIGRGGIPSKRRNDNNIKTVQDFRFWLSVNPTGLQEMLGAPKKRWDTITAQAKDCIINDKKMYYHDSSTGPLKGVIYDAVGELKGVIDESHFVPVDKLSADKKVDAEKLLMSVLEPSAFLQRYKTSFDDEDALLEKFPSRSSDSTDAFSNYLNASENIHVYPPTGPDLSSQSMVPELEIHDVTRPSGSLGSRDTCEQRDTGPCLFPEAGDTPTDPGLRFENHCLPTRLLSGKHKADAQELVASSCKNLGNMNHLRQHLTCGAGTSETIRESSSMHADTSFPSTSSTTNTFGENGAQDYGTSVGATNYMENVMYDDVARHNHAWQSSPDVFNGLEEWLQQEGFGAYVEPLPEVVSTSSRCVPNGWNFLLRVLKWWFSISRRVPHVTRKRKRQW